MPGPAFCAGDRGQHEDAGTDNGADAEDGQVERAELALERPFLGGFENQV